MFCNDVCRDVKTRKRGEAGNEKLKKVKFDKTEKYLELFCSERKHGVAISCTTYVAM